MQKPGQNVAFSLWMILLAAICWPGSAFASPGKMNGPALSLLTHVGKLARAVSKAEVAGWRTELARGGVQGRKAALLHLWLGEIEIARNREPKRALEQFAQAQRFVPHTDAISGCAAYDRAMTLFFEGAYAPSSSAFHDLLRPKAGLSGYSIYASALWYRHAGACAGYHAQHARLGITEPPSLDPLCGVASLAACVQAQGLPCDRKTLLANCTVSGLGNDIKDLRRAAIKMGLAAWTLKADDQGLMALPKPLVAYVEQDHFVAVTRADKNGVSYLCSDCGAWPGGRRDLTWKQWRAMDCNLYLAVSKRGSAEESALRSLRSQDPPSQLAQAEKGVSLARYERPQSTSQGASLLRLLGIHAVLYTPANAYCGQQSTSLQCTPCTNTSSDSGGSAPAATSLNAGPNDPVNLATGEEEYRADPDIVVYNPIGPSVVWQRQFGSMRGIYESPAGQLANGQMPYTESSFGDGWNTNYDLQVIVSTDNKQANLYLPNGSSYQFTIPSVPSAATPAVSCTSATGGVAMLCTWNYHSDGSLSFTFTQEDRSQWIFSSKIGYALAQMVDRNGNAINFNYITPGSNPGYQLASIADSAGRPLLTIQHNSHFNITGVSDRYGRSVYYQVKRYQNVNVPTPWAQYSDELTRVSQIVRTGTQLPPFRFMYGYQLNTDGEGAELTPALRTISVPSPTGKGTSTLTINYSGIFVGSVVDANGNTTTYTPIDANDTQVTVTDVHNKTVYSYKVNFDGQLRTVTRTDGTSQTLTYQATYQTDNPYQPYTVTDGNNHVTTYTYDSFGHVATVTSPRNVTTTYTWDYSAFGLGELKQVQVGTKSPVTVSYYEPSGLVQTITMPRPGTVGSTSTASTSFTYDSLGNVLTVVAPGNDSATTITTTFNYTQDGSYQQAAAIRQPLTVTDNLGHVTHFRYDTRGNQIAVADALGNKTTRIYSLANQIEYVSAPAIGDISGAVSVSRSKFTYSSTTQTYNSTLTLTNTGNTALTGHFAAVLTNLMPGVTLANSAGSYVGNPMAISPMVTLASGQSTVLNVQFSNSTTAAISFGVQTYLVDNNGNPMARNATTSYSYLYPGGPLSAISAYDESGNLLRQVRYRYGAQGETVAVAGSTEPVTYTYDAGYRLHSLAGGNGNATLYTYNTAGYLASITYPKGDRVQYPLYDAMGNVLKRIDGRGIETDYTYNDPESRLTSVKYVNNALYPKVSQYNVSIQYDSYGRIQDIFDYAGHTNRAYDDLDTITDITTTYKGASGNLPAVSLTYGFNPNGSRATMELQTTTTSYSFAYSYDAAGRPKSLTNPFNETTQWTYLDNNWLSTQQLANGVLTQYAYNRRGFLNDLTNYSSNGSLLSDFGTMTYDAVGNRLAKIATVPGAPAAYSGVTTYQYDMKDQLTQEVSTLAGSYTHTFGYDAEGNPTTFRGTTHTFNANDQFKDTGFVYDGNGNPTTYNGTALTFDPENHMTAFGSGLTIGYRADGLRAWKQTSTNRTYFVYDGFTPLCELNSAGTVTAINTFGANGLISRHLSVGSSLYAFDPQGNTVQRLDASANVLAANEFDAFGSAFSSQADPFGYGAEWGYYYDNEDGMDLLGYRYNDPNAGRFLTRDLVGYWGGINVYAYVYNTPVNLVDPVGLWGFGFEGNTTSLGGVGILGGAGSVSLGYGAFWGGNQGVNFGGYFSRGAFIGGPGYGPSYPYGNANNAAFGAYAGIGGGIFFTNANSPKDLEGPFDTWDIAISSLGIQIASSNGIWIFSVSIGPPSPTGGVSFYKTNTDCF